MHFNDAYRFMNWLLTALRLLIETFPVTKLVLISGRMTFIAVYQQIVADLIGQNKPHDLSSRLIVGRSEEVSVAS